MGTSRKQSRTVWGQVSIWEAPVLEMAITLGEKEGWEGKRATD